MQHIMCMSLYIKLIILDILVLSFPQKISYVFQIILLSRIITVSTHMINSLYLCHWAYISLPNPYAAYQAMKVILIMY